MSRSPLAINESWRDYSGAWNPAVLPWIAKLEGSKCHAPRWAAIPPVAEAVIPSSGKLEYNFHLLPGSLIWGITPPITNFLSQGPTAFQLTDVGVGHQLFQEPLDPLVASHVTGSVANTEDFMILPTPWPVTGAGLFTLEAWGQPGNYVFMILHVAEVTTCPVR
jgi:hypothetical protein